MKPLFFGSQNPIGFECVEVLGKGPRPGTAWVHALNGLEPFTKISHGGPYQDSPSIVLIPRLIMHKGKEDDVHWLRFLVIVQLLVHVLPYRNPLIFLVALTDKFLGSLYP